MTTTPRHRIFYWLKWLALAGVLVVLLSVIALIWLFQASQQVPEFYSRAIEIAPERAAEAGDRLERAVLELHNEVIHEDRFQMTFTDEEVNGWLASDLIEKFPERLPPSVRDPRVAFEEGAAIIAFRYEEGNAKTIVTVRADIHLLEDEDVLSVTLRALHAGTVPIPIGPVLENLKREAEQRRLPIRWEDDRGSPVALIPLRLGDQWVKDRQLILENIYLEPGKLTIAGRAVEVPQPGNEEPADEEPGAENRSRQE